MKDKCKSCFRIPYQPDIITCIPNHREAVEGAKRVMTKEILHNKVAGQNSRTPYMSLKTHPSTKNKIVKFAEYRLLHNKIDRLTK